MVRRSLTTVAALLASLVSVSVVTARENTIYVPLDAVISATSAGITWTVSDPLTGSGSLPTRTRAGEDGVSTTPGDGNGESRPAPAGFTRDESESLENRQPDQWTPLIIGVLAGSGAFMLAFAVFVVRREAEF